MLCIKWIRSNPNALDRALESRGLPPHAEQILRTDKAYRQARQTVEELQQRSNSIAKSSKPIEEKRVEAKALKHELSQITEIMHQRQAELDAILLRLPNILCNSVPIDPQGTRNQAVHTKGIKPSFSFTPKHHADFHHLGIDEVAGAKLSGSRFTVLRGPIAILENALQRFMIDHHTQKGYELISTPVLVNTQTLTNTGQLPKFSADLFHTQTDHWLLPTSEASLTSLVAKKTFTKDDRFPLRFVALTECFRREAGAAGRQTRGLIRQHQFSKVELVHITTQEQEGSALEELTQSAESILDALQLHYRRILLCSGDTGFSANKTYDLEVWMPGIGEYCEISSCSSCGTFQSRRMSTRYKASGQESQLAITLNGSGLAIGRTIAAIIENYQQENGNVTVPEVLRPYIHQEALSTSCTS